MFPIAANRSDEENTTPYSDDVFSTTLYTGNGSTQTITNGIDLAGKGGLVWSKRRNVDLSNLLFDTVRGNTKYLLSNTSGAEGTDSPATYLTSFNGNGFSVGAVAATNNLNDTYASWTFRKAAKFFDVVTYTGNGTSNRAIPHSLGIAPGMVIVKATNQNDNWTVWHNYNVNKFGILNLTSQFYDDNGTTFGGTSFPPTSSSFYVNSALNQSGFTYVAYLFAHDTSSTGIIQCGSFTTDGSGNATVNLGWEPQYVMYKSSSSVENWFTRDVMRGWSHSSNAFLLPNTYDIETMTNGDYTSPQATGMQFGPSGGALSASTTYIYMAIRRPNKPPTSASQVFSPSFASSSGAFTAVSNFPSDLNFYGAKGSTDKWFWFTRLIGASYLRSNTTAAEQATGITVNYTNTNFNMPAVTGDYSTYINYMFARAPGFFDVVCYTGTGVATTQAHNLGVAPELMIVKCRSTSGNSWTVYTSTTGNTKALFLDSTSVADTAIGYWNNTSPTNTVFTIGASIYVNTSATTYVAYLFATLAGISKVGSYTGNGGTQAINCGFTAGARFVLIKRTDSTGDWFVWDTARGIVTGNDPHLSLNTTAVEVTTYDSIDPYSAGFAVNQVAATNINVTSATYIFLAIA